jgi:hypothetical protein
MNLGLQTVRTIVDQGAGRDRTTVKHLQRIDPARFSEEPWAGAHAGGTAEAHYRNADAVA